MKTKAQYAIDINNIAKIEGMGDIHDVGTIGGTISSYSVSSKSNNALSINFKNSLYKKVSGAEGGRQNHEPATSTFEEISQSMYFQSQLGHHPTHRNDNKTKLLKSKSRSRSRERRRRGMTTIDAAEQHEQHVQQRSTFDDLKSDNLLPTDYLNSRSSSNDTTSQISGGVSKTSQFTDISKLKSKSK
jgi:hypothetical protein